MTYFDFIPRVAGYRKEGKWCIPSRQNPTSLPRPEEMKVVCVSVNDLREGGDLPALKASLDD